MYVYILVSTRLLASKVGFSSRLEERLHRYNTRVQQWRYGMLVYVPPARRLSGRAIVRYVIDEASTALAARVDVLTELARELALPVFIDRALLSPSVRCLPAVDATTPQDVEAIQRLLDTADRSSATQFRGRSFARAAAAVPSTTPPPPRRLEPLALRSLVDNSST